MTDDTAKKLAEAMNRLAAAIENVSPTGMAPGGVHVWHHGAPQASDKKQDYGYGTADPQWPPRYPVTF